MGKAVGQDWWSIQIKIIPTKAREATTHPVLFVRHSHISCSLLPPLSLHPSLLNQYPLCLLSISIRIGAVRVLRTTRYDKQTRPRRHRQKRLQNPQMPTLCRFAASQGFVKSLELRRKRETGKELSVVCIYEYVLVNWYSFLNCQCPVLRDSAPVS